MASPGDEVRANAQALAAQPDRSLLSLIGEGLISFGAGKPVTQLRNEAAIAQINQQQVEIGQQDIEAEQRAVERQQQTQALIGTVQQGGPQADEAANRLFQINPEMADQLFQSMGATSSAQREDASRRAAEIQATPPDQREAVIRRQAEELRAEGRDPRDTESLLRQSPQDQDNALRLTQAAALSTKERETVAATQISQEQAERGLDIAQQRVDVQAETATATRSLAEATRITKTVQATLKTEEGLRKEVNMLLKDFFQVADANARVLAAGTEPSAAGDLALIFNFMKMLDPGSTVREGEFATAQNSAGVPERTRARWNNMLKGERLGPGQREDFLARAASLFEAAQSEATKTANAFERIASDAGVDVNNVLATFQERAGVAPTNNGTTNVGRFAVETVQ